MTRLPKLLARALFTAAVVLAVGSSMPAAGAGAYLQRPMPEAGNLPASINLPGGLRAVLVPGKARVDTRLNVPAQQQGCCYILLNSSYQQYAITDQPTNSNGRLANHLYMWQDNNWSTQRWYYYFFTNNTYTFQSEYNGYCMNVPGYSTMPGTQMIIYPCNPGSPTANEEFYSNGTMIWPSYDTNLAIAIGSNFPGNGAWVMIYTGDSSNWKEQWVFAG